MLLPEHNLTSSEAKPMESWLHCAFSVLASAEIQDTIEVTHFLDNESVINCIQQTHQRMYKTPAQKLSSEQDVIDELNKILHALPMKINFKWVKDHQDTTAMYESWTLSAQLDCNAVAMQIKKWTKPGKQIESTPLSHTPFVN